MRGCAAYALPTRPSRTSSETFGIALAEKRPVLGCGAELKKHFCLVKDRHAFVSHHIGDLANYETLASFVAGIEHFGRLFDIEPAVVAHDLHPEYLFTSTGSIWRASNWSRCSTTMRTSRRAWRTTARRAYLAAADPDGPPNGWMSCGATRHSGPTCSR